MGSLLKLDAIEQPLNITCYGVGCHNKRGIKGVDVFARNRTFGMSNQRCNSDLREPQIVRKACEAVSQDMRGNTIKGRRSEEHTSELQSLMRISYAVFCLKKKSIANIEQSHVSAKRYSH